MNRIYVEYDAAGDVLDVDLYVGVSEEQLPKRHHNREIDFYRHLYFDKDDRLLGVVFLAASRGIDLRGVPEAERIAAGLAQLRGVLGEVITEEQTQAAS